MLPSAGEALLTCCASTEIASRTLRSQNQILIMSPVADKHITSTCRFISLSSTKQTTQPKYDPVLTDALKCPGFVFQIVTVMDVRSTESASILCPDHGDPAQGQSYISHRHELHEGAPNASDPVLSRIKFM